jgi:exoribonuclease-2
MTSESKVRPGSLVAWWDGRDLSFALVTGEEKQRLRLVLEQGREERVKPSRIAVQIETPGPLPESTAEGRGQAAERVAHVAARVRRLAGDVDVGLIWEIVREGTAEESGPVLGLGELVELALERSTGEAHAATLLALSEDGVSFVRRGDRWEARSRRAVEGLRQQKQRMAERQEQTRQFLDRLSAVVQGESFRPFDTPMERRYLDALERLAIHEEAVPDATRAVAVEALAASGLRYDRPHEGAFRLLRRLGRFTSDDENLQLRRYRLHREFPPEVLSHVRSGLARGSAREGRDDLTHLEVVSIDGVYTREIDDALSLESREQGGWRLGVHVADPAAFVTSGDPVDREALARAVTHYLPELRLTMLPPEISERAASLVEGEERPALSFLVEIDDRGEIAGFEIVRSMIRSRARLDYARADRIIEAHGQRFHDLLSELRLMADLREAARVRCGAIVIDAPEVDVHVASSGRVTLERVDAGSAARRCVTEAMVTAGAVAAQFCADGGLPVIYRRQAAPAQQPSIPQEGVRDPVAVRAMRRCLKRAEVGLQPGPHASLGLSAYAQVTSPMRRYQDLVTHRQIVARLRGDSALPYDEEAMQRIAATTERAESEARRAERASNDFWLLRYLEERTGHRVDATVVEVEPRPVVQLAETLWETPLPSLVGAQLGETLQLTIERVNPRAGLLVLRKAG